MSRHILSSVSLLVIQILQVSAQLLSCANIDEAGNYNNCRCKVDGTTFSELGVATFTSDLSPIPLSWTIGLAPKVFTNTTSQRRYYLGTPQGLNLSSRTDITGCALFFTGIEAGLRFAEDNDGSGFDRNDIAGTCADALGSTCVADLLTQAFKLVTISTALGNLSCSGIGQALQSSPPLSCTSAGTWGSITAKSIAGPDSPSPLQLGSCHPTFNKTYEIRSVATFPEVGLGRFESNVTPLMTILATSGNATDGLIGPEVNLNCMMPLEDEPPNQIGFHGSSNRLTIQRSYTSFLVALLGFMTGCMIPM